jgi:8-oxo-dGTP diphosphatase
MKTVTAAIIIREGKVLLARRKQGEALAGFWEFPGGKVEPGETPEECLRRELKEELGIAAAVGDMLAESEYQYAAGAVRLLAMETRIVEGELALTVHDRADWVASSDLDCYNLAPADKPIAAILKERKLLF